MKRDKLTDQKNLFSYAFWSTINWIAIGCHFTSFEVIGRENLPDKGPFFLVSNHISRWDGLIVYNMLGRPTNFMVSPNELLGFQGAVLRSMGSFPANPRFDLQSFANEQIAKGEGIVIFPEGDVYRDGTTHQFKTGAAKLALNVNSNGAKVPVIPVAINYSEDGKTARLMIGEAIDIDSYSKEFVREPLDAVRALTQRLHREVCHIKYSLGAEREALTLFAGNRSKNWTKLAERQHTTGSVA